MLTQEVSQAVDGHSSGLGRDNARRGLRLTGVRHQSPIRPRSINSTSAGNLDWVASSTSTTTQPDLHGCHIRHAQAHRADCQKPISADTLRVRLGIGAAPARHLVKVVREEHQAQTPGEPVEADICRS
jgi:hypothetical protein